MESSLLPAVGSGQVWADAGNHPKVQRWDQQPGVDGSALQWTDLMSSGTSLQAFLPA